MTLTYQGEPCTNIPSVISYSAQVTDDYDPAQELRVTLSYSGAISGSVGMSRDGDVFSGAIGPFAWEDEKYQNASGTIDVTIVAVDAAGQTTSISGAGIDLVGCPLIS